VNTGADAFGEMLLRGLAGEDVAEIVERDDGFIAVGTAGPRPYFAPRRAWPPVERRAWRYVRGRVLDVGCGGGRVCLEAQAKGLEVVGIDISPGAVETARRRGATDVRVLGIDDVDDSLGAFDTIVMFGNNFGLFGAPGKARRLLRRFIRLTTAQGRIVATTHDTGDTEDPTHLAYHRRNRESGRLGGQRRLRVRFRDLVGVWFDYLFVSQEELTEIVDGTGWTIARILEDGGPSYCAVLEKEPSRSSTSQPSTGCIGP
jgi:SAM-dependent methyltransferase